jgi:hypothetical protein
MDIAPSKATVDLHGRMADVAQDAGIDENHAFAQDHWRVTAEALRIIADHVGSLPGRKNLVWVSGSFPFNIETNNLQRTMNGQKIPFATEVELAWRALTNANVAVYPVDARGLVPTRLDGSGASSNAEQDMDDFATMQILAQRTGGFAFHDTNAIKGSIRQTIDASRVTYQLGFYPDDVNWDGSFHTVRVKLNRPNVHAQAREGYFALAEPKVTSQTWAEMNSEIARSPVEATGLRIRVKVTPSQAPSQAPDEKTLSLAVSLDAAQFQFEQENGAWNDVVSAAFIQLDAKNKIIQTSQMRLPLALDSDTYEQLLKQGMVLPRELQILPDATALQVMVRDGASNKVGSVHIPLTE